MSVSVVREERFYSCLRIYIADLKFGDCMLGYGGGSLRHKGWGYIEQVHNNVIT